ncbi:hypothetical protein [Streptomyces sp. VRA16 Mangrove soil]|uniref:hypothetical protein n=1 Tax=Streptomyces sp. VRA16 Mangrove soil TaxID=2817434 RepID=UPI001A9E7460|nr:hypothetical protein [Streptomyces sp. VRA16 Mangrove soil]
MLEQLLAAERSLCGTATAAAVDALRATLRAALDAAPDDPGAPAGARLLAGLDALRGAPAADGAWPRLRPGSPERPAAAGLAEPAAELAKSAAVEDYAPGAVPPSAAGPDDEDRLRRWYHLTLLRLPERHAAPFRRRAAQLDPPPPGRWHELPGRYDEELLPPAPEGRAGLRTRRTPGGAGLRELSRIALRIGEFDASLCHLLEGLWTGGSALLCDPDVRDAYAAELDRRLDAVDRTADATPERVRALVRAAEAVCSVVHLPPAPPTSWWYRYAEDATGIVLDAARTAHAAGHDVEVFLPAGPYREARRHTQTDDVRLTAGGRPGDTLACLRLWLRAGDQVFPGRVVYRGTE